MLSIPRPICPVPLFPSVIVEVNVLDTHVKVVGQLIIKLSVGGPKAEPVEKYQAKKTMNTTLGHVSFYLALLVAIA